MLVKDSPASERRIRYCLTHDVQKDHPPLIYGHCKACPSQCVRRQWPHLPLNTKATEGHMLGNEHQAVPVILERLKEFCLSLFWGKLSYLHETWLEINVAVFYLNRFSYSRSL